ncbi:MAG: hypothetical protein EOP48_21800 [Sphingobacteriales bacterium]|nr:MAG: hypothetical protein EOP48_21800 [Sphingobacteriales bacterium]
MRLPENGIENNRVGGVYVYDRARGEYAWLGGLQEGQRIGNQYAYQQVSVYSTDAEAEKGPVDMLLPSASKIKYGGDVNWLDVDKNDTIDTRDRVYMGNTIPRVTGGFTNTVNYKYLSLIVRMDYTLGATIYNETAARLEGNFSGANAISSSMLRSWQKEGDVTDKIEYLSLDTKVISESEFEKIKQPDFQYLRMKKYDPKVWKEFTTLEPVQEMKQFSITEN